MKSSCIRHRSRHVRVTIAHQMGLDSHLSPQLRKDRSIIQHLHPVLGIQLLGNTANRGPAHHQLYVPARFSNSQFGKMITPDRPWRLSSVAGLSVYVTGVCPLPVSASHVLLRYPRSNITFPAKLLGHVTPAQHSCWVLFQHILRVFFNMQATFTGAFYPIEHVSWYTSEPCTSPGRHLNK